MALIGALLHRGLGYTLATPSAEPAANLASLGSELGRHETFLSYPGGEITDRVEMTFTAKMPKPAPGAPSGYSQRRTGVLIKIPRDVDGAGTISFDTAKVEFSTDINTSAEDRLELLLAVAEVMGVIVTRAALIDGNIG
jgi:hypothetical protein